MAGGGRHGGRVAGARRGQRRERRRPAPILCWPFWPGSRMPRPYRLRAARKSSRSAPRAGFRACICTMQPRARGRRCCLLFIGLAPLSLISPRSLRSWAALLQPLLPFVPAASAVAPLVPTRIPSQRRRAAGSFQQPCEPGSYANGIHVLLWLSSPLTWMVVMMMIAGWITFLEAGHKTRRCGAIVKVGITPRSRRRAHVSFHGVPAQSRLRRQGADRPARRRGRG